ncbi:hypothetical protein [Desulfopila sp. IMCC35008]|uniref:hypothetical protein n=1 Tax=Desulfopila sp. IMCC35008 TaxID=2653858 RepID=UPI0013D1B44F|nr:hypothetical protein [Desulfopila sp. IMCC35008]
MKKGDSVIANHPESGSREFVRSYGIVQEMTKSGGVIIKLADGSLIKRQINSVAVYIQPPSNWFELFRQKQTVYPQPRKNMTTRRSTPQKLDM